MCICTRDWKHSLCSSQIALRITSGLRPISDAFNQHYLQDSLRGSSYLNDHEVVQLLIKQGPKHIEYLMNLGVAFSKDQEGRLMLHREGGHSQNRVVHVDDFTGKAIANTLSSVVRNDNIQILEYSSVVELITDENRNNSFLDSTDSMADLNSIRLFHLDSEEKNYTQNQENNQVEKQCHGAYIYDRKKWNVFPIFARNTVLATGGAAQVYLHTTNPEIATGDGIALAYRAGAKIANMEFYQFHPTALYEDERKSKQTFLISEILRGSGGKLLNKEGEAFMNSYDNRGDLAPRDIIALSMDKEMKKSGVKHLG